MLSDILKDSADIPKTILYKLEKKLLTLSDEKEACTNPRWAYYFARNVPGANKEKCHEAACKEPYWAYWFARDIPGADIGKCCESACKSLYWEYYFAKNIPWK